MTRPHTIRKAVGTDSAAITEISVLTGLSSEVDAATFVPDDAVNEPGDASVRPDWLAVEDDQGHVVGAAYYGPEQFSDRIWNLWFIAVTPASQGAGIGGSLLDAVEDRLRELGSTKAKVLLVETSSVDSFAPTRNFYLRHGYSEEARIPHYYGQGDHKVIFWKSLTTSDYVKNG